MFWPRVSPDGRSSCSSTPSDSAGRDARVRAAAWTSSRRIPIPGTEGLRRAYWSPDGREIAFVADDKIQRVPIGGGSPIVICAAPGGVRPELGLEGA